MRSTWFVFVCIVVWLSQVVEGYVAISLYLLLQQQCNKSSATCFHCHSGLSFSCSTTTTTSILSNNLTKRLRRRRTWMVVSVLYNGPTLSHLKIAPSLGGSGRPSNTWFLGPIRVHNPNDISFGSSIVAQLTTVTDRQTDRPCYSVCNNRPHLLQCGLVAY